MYRSQQKFHSRQFGTEGARSFKRPYLIRRCKDLQLEDMYRLYSYRLSMGVLFVYIILQMLQSFSYILLLLLAAHHPHLIYIDVVCALVACLLIWLILSINFNEELVMSHWWIPHVTSYLVIIIIMTQDIGLNLYNYVTREIALGTFYGVYVLFVIYLFLPIPNIMPPLYLGILVALCYTCYFVFVVEHTYAIDTALICDLGHLFGIILMGSFFRLMRDITIRSSFLDRYMYIEEDIMLRDAKVQEHELLHSILPTHIATKMQIDLRNRILNRSKRGSRNTEMILRTSAFQSHQNISILYADVVNYTYLTTTLEVEALVELLHDLYCHFDKASERYDVQRIKFLGDCYYCVAGLSGPIQDHAKRCIDLGLHMIKSIAKVRKSRNLDIDMRIGVHSGDLIAGVIGSSKFQYDIWSKDVNIANRLESTGVPGRIHCSEQTLSCLDDDYTYEPGPESAQNDDLLKLRSISTYLIIELKPFAEEKHDWISKRHSLKSRATVENILSITEINLIDQCKHEMQTAMDQMPVRRSLLSLLFCRSTHYKPKIPRHVPCESNFSTFWMKFRDPNLEYQYVRVPDTMMRYSITLSLIVFTIMVILQSLTPPNNHLYWYVNSINYLLLTVLFVISWYKKIWQMWIADVPTYKPSHRLSLKLYTLSETMENKRFCRICIYFFIILACCSVLIIDVWSCNHEAFMVTMVENRLFGYDDPALCFNPWIFSSSVTLLFGITFIFTRIPFSLKTIVGSLLLVAYNIFVLFQYDYVFETSMSTNVSVDANYAHLLFVDVSFVCFYLMERQTESNAKVHFCWKRDLMLKQAAAKLTAASINMLLTNILPAHVVNVYLSKCALGELYFEEHDKVAVMFASIKNFDTSRVGLRVLNEIICQFDEVLNYYKDDWKVEKIKVVDWTYMAACGLDIKRMKRGTFLSNVDMFPQELKDDLKSINDDDIVVLIMAQFALDLYRTLYSYTRMDGSDRETSIGQIRIGLSYGKVMAGVVGHTTPHYDIWGNPVNMASRMDSTGVDGHMQVTEETALILRKYRIGCTYRGLTFVKGRGEIPTYFVNIDDKMNFIKTNLKDEV